MPPFRNSLNAELQQYPVGQGFFHSGTLHFSGHDPMQYIYDCGSENAVPRSQAISSFQPLSHSLHALFVSHFHQDHINGLPELLVRFAHVENVFLPYMHPVQRLMLGASDRDWTFFSGGDFQGFLDDPPSWFVDRGATRVVYVGRFPTDGDPNEPPKNPIPYFEENTPEDPVSVRLEKLDEESAGRHVAPGDSELHAKLKGRTSCSVRLMNHTSPITVQARDSFIGWVLQTYVDPDAEIESLVHQSVRTALGDADYNCLVSGGVRCTQILANRGLRDRLCQAYRTATGSRSVRRSSMRDADPSGMNRTTLSLFSGPVFRPGAISCAAIGRFLNFGGIDHLTHDPIRNGWLLLGDATLRDGDVLDRLAAFFDDAATEYLRRTLIFTVPHHGSRRNLANLTLTRLRMPPFAVISAGVASRHRHPNLSVVHLIERRGAQVFHVHEEAAGLRDILSIRVCH